MHRHHRPEGSAGHLQTLGFEGRHDVFDEWLGNLGIGCGGERGPPAAPHAAKERELADHQYRPTDIDHRSVHEADLVPEDPQAGDLRRQGLCIALVIAVLDADEQNQALPDRPDDLSGHRNRRLGDALYD